MCRVTTMHVDIGYTDPMPSQCCTIVASAGNIQSTLSSASCVVFVNIVPLMVTLNQCWFNVGPPSVVWVQPRSSNVPRSTLDAYPPEGSYVVKWSTCLQRFPLSGSNYTVFDYIQSWTLFNSTDV